MALKSRRSRHTTGSIAARVHATASGYPGFAIQKSLYHQWVTSGSPVLESPVLDSLVRFGHALSDATRSRVLLRLRTGPAYPADLADELGVSRQKMSNHLACLRGCGLVAVVPEGRRARYELADAGIGRALDDLMGLVLTVDPSCCPDAETDGCC